MTNSNSGKPDDFDTVRTIVLALQNFEKEDQRRIIRWAQEKLELAPGTHSATPSSGGIQPPPRPVDIRNFVEQKKPSSDIEFTAVVAYFHRFEAIDIERKEEISAEDLQEAARKTVRPRLKRPSDTLQNALKSGLLDKGSGRGLYKINTVGENLVAMILPSTKTEKPKHKIRPARKTLRTKRSIKTPKKKIK